MYESYVRKNITTNIRRWTQPTSNERSSRQSRSANGFRSCGWNYGNSYASAKAVVGGDLMVEPLLSVKKESKWIWKQRVGNDVPHKRAIKQAHAKRRKTITTSATHSGHTLRQQNYINLYKWQQQPVASSMLKDYEELLFAQKIKITTTQNTTTR